MRKVTSIGVVSDGCEDCHKLKKSLSDDFNSVGIEIEFVEIVYEYDPATAIKVSEEYNFDDIPSFYVCGVVFKKGYKKKDVDKAVENIILKK